MDTFSIIFTQEAQDDFDNIKDARTYTAIERKIDELRTEPDQRGEALKGDLKDYRKLKAARRYRVIYEVAMLEGLVTVVVVGIRKEGDKRDAYRIASKRLGNKKERKG